MGCLVGLHMKLHLGAFIHRTGSLLPSSAIHARGKRHDALIPPGGLTIIFSLRGKPPRSSDYTASQVVRHDSCLCLTLQRLLRIRVRSAPVALCDMRKLTSKSGPRHPAARISRSGSLTSPMGGCQAGPPDGREPYHKKYIKLQPQAITLETKC